METIFCSARFSMFWFVCGCVECVCGVGVCVGVFFVCFFGFFNLGDAT